MTMEFGPELTLATLGRYGPGEVIDCGKADGGKAGLDVYDEPGEVSWCAVTGQAGDWAVYVGPAKWTWHEVARMGNKIHDINKVRMVVPCDAAAVKKYRR
jgi:hypothetical protein